MSLNNKGFAISGVLYSLLILFVTLFIGILTIFATTKFSLDKVKNDIISKLEPKSLKEIVTTSDENPSIPDCIINNTTCVAGTGVAIKVNDSQTYDFYVMSEDASEGTITLIMNQNLGETVAWISKADYISVGGTEADWGTYGNNNKGPITALNYLKNQTSSWTNIPSQTYTLTDDNNSTQKYTTITRAARARMITYTEANTLLSLSDNSWVYGNLSSSSTTYAYWTSSSNAGASGYAWLVHYDGSTTSSNVYIGSNYGVRPVITISKSVI